MQPFGCSTYLIKSETPKLTFNPFDYPSTWGDSARGQIIDWSGVTAVCICMEPECGTQHGPYFSVEDARAGGSFHRRQEHTDAYRRAQTREGDTNGWVSVIKPVSEEAKAACISPCQGCGGEIARDRGYCRKCNLKQARDWAILNGALPEGAPTSWASKIYRDPTFNPWEKYEPLTEADLQDAPVLKAHMERRAS